MDHLTCTRVRQSRFIDRDVVFDIDYDDRMGFGGDRRIEKSMKLRKEFKDLGMAFHRHRVELRFDASRENRDTPEWMVLRERVKEFCDTKCQGYWTWKTKRMASRTSDDYTFEMDLMFEHEEDMKLWLKEHGLIIRLSM